MPTFIIYNNQALAEAFQSLNDVALGYPKEGTDLSGGVHNEEGLTEHYVGIRKHPTKSLWAIQVDETVRGFMTNGEQEETLDNSWKTPRPN